MAHCPNCSMYPLSLNRLVAHLKVTPNCRSISIYSCKEDNCGINFPTWAMYRRHLLKEHKICNELIENSNSVPQQNVEPELPEAEPFSCDSDFDEEENLIDGLTFKKGIDSLLLSFIGKMYATSNIPRSYVQTMVDDVSDLFQGVFSAMGKIVNASSLNVVEEDQSFASLSTLVLSSFETFGTEYRRLKALNGTGYFIEPIPYTVAVETEEKLVKGQMAKVQVNRLGFYIPLEAVLKSFFSLPGVLNEVLNYVDYLEKQDGFISNFIQGALWREKKERYFKDKTVFPLFVYYDDFEINNPLGSHSTVQKLGGTYFTIPCLPPDRRSLLDNIFMALLTHASDRHDSHVNLCRNSEVFGVLIKQINKLQNCGISIIDGKGQKQTIYFALGLVIGDNEGLNSVLGYVEGFSANYFCRTCKVHKTKTQTDVSERANMLRSKDEYEMDLQTHFSESGIKERCVFNDVAGFHVYDNLTGDLLHDAKEGFLKYGMYYIVYHHVYVTKKISLSTLNDRIKCFDFYGNGIYNRPPLISENDMKTEKRIKMSGSEMMNFVLVYSMLVEDSIEFDEVWTYYLTIRRIMDILLAPSIHVSATYALDVLTSEHNRLYLKLFRNLQPKLHMIVHYGRILRHSGPLCHLCSIRCEGKHRPNKISASATSSRKLITKTLSIKEQLRLCYLFVSGRGFAPRIEIGPASLPNDDSCNDYKLPPSFDLDYVEIPWVNFKGTKYRVGMYVSMGFEPNGLPKIGSIKKILYDDRGKVCLVCEEMYTLGLDIDVHAYDIVHGTKSMYTSILIDNLTMYAPVIVVRSVSGNLYATFKYAP